MRASRLTCTAVFRPCWAGRLRCRSCPSGRRSASAACLRPRPRASSTTSSNPHRREKKHMAPSYNLDLSGYRPMVSDTVPDGRYLAMVEDYDFSKSKSANDMLTIWVRIVKIGRASWRDRGCQYV